MPARTSSVAPEAQQPASPSSPSLKPPIADAPGPRAQTLCNAFDKALENTLRKCNYENFAACFPTPAEYRAETLDAFWRDFVGRLEGFCKENFEQLLADRAVVPALNELHRLIEDAKARKQEAEIAAEAEGRAVDVPVAPHTLAPDALYASHLMPFLSTQQGVLSAQLGEIQQSNAAVMEDIERQRAEMQGLLVRLEGVVGDLEGSSGMMKGEQVQGLSGEIRAIDMELAG